MSENVEANFRERVEALVAQIPVGKVMTYGQLAALCGSPRAARIVGGIAHYGDPDLPWQRVVNKQGGLASGYPGGKAGHAEVLEAEGYEVIEYTVNTEKCLWRPSLFSNGPLIVIVGETASGKSALAMDLAQKFNGEIICADAMTVYKDFDIGTAKPSPEEQTLIPHHLLGVTTAPEGYSAPQFKRAAIKAIADIHSRGSVPILVGGTGLYVDSVLYDYSFLEPSNSAQRETLNALSLAELIDLATRSKLPIETIDLRNKRRIIRLIENNGAMPGRSSVRKNTLVLGINSDKDELETRIVQRVNSMLEQGLEHEVANLSKRYGWDVEPMKAIGYREWREYFEGTQTPALTIERIISGTKRLAKKQRTWFKRNNSIHWVHNRDEAVATTTTFLNK